MLLWVLAEKEIRDGKLEIQRLEPPPFVTKLGAALQCVQHIRGAHMLPHPRAWLRAHGDTSGGHRFPQDPRGTTQLPPRPLLCSMWGPLVRVALSWLSQGGLGSRGRALTHVWDRQGEIWEESAPCSCKESAGVVRAAGAGGMSHAQGSCPLCGAPEIAPTTLLAAEAASPVAPACRCRLLSHQGRG